MKITDNGKGIPQRRRAHTGLGLRNMAERMEQLDGQLTVMTSRGGTTIEARVPLTHMLSPKESGAAEEDPA